MDVNWSSATFKIVAQNSCSEDAILELDGCGSDLAVSWRRTVSGSDDVKWLSKFCGPEQSEYRKIPFCGYEQSGLATGSNAVPALRSKVLIAGYLD